MEGFPQTQVSACVAHSYAHWPTARLHNRHTYKIIIIILFDQSCNVTHVFIFILFFYSHQCGFTLLRVNAFHDASLPCEAVVVFMFYISTTMRSGYFREMRRKDCICFHANPTVSHCIPLYPIPLHPTTFAPLFLRGYMFERDSDVDEPLTRKHQR